MIGLIIMILIKQSHQSFHCTVGLV